MVNKDHLSDKAKKDLQLVEIAIKGNQSAYAELMDRYRESIYFMMLNNYIDCKEILKVEVKKKMWDFGLHFMMDGTKNYEFGSDKHFFHEDEKENTLILS